MIHLFRSTGEAYDACQCDQNIKNGDTLLIPSEYVVGIAGTWPYAITENYGDLHTLKEPEPIPPELEGIVALFNQASK